MFKELEEGQTHFDLEAERRARDNEKEQVYNEYSSGKSILEEKLQNEVGILVDKMRAKYLPTELDGLEPALTQDICEIVLHFYKQLLEEDIKIMEGMRKTPLEGMHPTDCHIGHGYNCALSDLIDSKREALNKLKD